MKYLRSIPPCELTQQRDVIVLRRYEWSVYFTLRTRFRRYGFAWSSGRVTAVEMAAACLKFGPRDLVCSSIGFDEIKSGEPGRRTLSFLAPARRTPCRQEIMKRECEFFVNCLNAQLRALSEASAALLLLVVTSYLSLALASLRSHRPFVGRCMPSSRLVSSSCPQQFHLLGPS